MKKLLVVLLIAVAVISCKEEKEKQKSFYVTPEQKELFNSFRTPLKDAAYYFLANKDKIEMTPAWFKCGEITFYKRDGHNNFALFYQGSEIKLTPKEKKYFWGLYQNYINNLRLWDCDYEKNTRKPWYYIYMQPDNYSSDSVYLDYEIIDYVMLDLGCHKKPNHIDTLVIIDTITEVRVGNVMYSPRYNGFHEIRAINGNKVTLSGCTEFFRDSKTTIQNYIVSADYLTEMKLVYDKDHKFMEWNECVKGYKATSEIEDKTYLFFRDSSIDSMFINKDYNIRYRLNDVYYRTSPLKTNKCI